MPDDYTIRTYRRVHKQAHPEDVEEGKIKRETGSYVEKSKRRRSLERRLLDDPDNEDLVDELAEVETAREKVRRTAKAHKKRLRKLKDQGL